MTVELARRLLASGVPSSDIEAALLFSVARGIPIARALVDRGIVSERVLEEELGRWAGVALRQVAVAKELWARLPPSMCRRLGAVPMRFDQAAGVIEVAAIDPLDPHVGSEFAFHLGQPVRVQRATLGVVEEALRRLELGEAEPTVQRNRRRTPAFPHGAPKSSAPPPPAEEVPIPLVRRVTMPFLEAAPDTERMADAQRQRRGRGSEKSLPSVSFPSSPPPADEEESGRSRTPPLGMMAVRDSAAPITIVPAARARPDPNDADVRTLRMASVAGEPEAGWPAWSPPSSTLEAGFANVSLSVSSTPPVGPPPLPVVEIPSAIDPAPEFSSAPVASTPPSDPRSSATDSRLYVAASFRDALDQVIGADSRDAVVDAVLEAARVLAPRVALFVARKDGFRGWKCTPAFGDEKALRGVIMPGDMPSIFATATAAGFYLGPVPHTPGHAGLLAVMAHAGPDVAVNVVRVAGKPAMLVVADGLDDTLRGTRALGDLAKAAGAALSRLLTHR